MSLSYKILNLQQVNGASNTLNGIVGTVEYEIKSNETGRSISGFANLDLSEISEANFISLDQLTEETVIDWVKERIGLERLNAIEEQLSAVVETPYFTYSNVGLPWKN